VGEPGSESRGHDAESSAGDSVATIWGTNIDVAKAERKAERFFRRFADARGELKYEKILEDMGPSEVYHLNLDCEDLLNDDPELYNWLIMYPTSMIPLMDNTINKIFSSNFPDLERSKAIQVRPYNLKNAKHMRDLNPDDIDTLVSIRGMVSRVTSITPDLKIAFFRCAMCGDEVTVGLDRGRIDEPERCQRGECNAKFSYELVHNRCKFADKQTVKLQETPDSIPEGETPHVVNLITFEELIDVVRPGDRIDVTGIFHANPIRLKNSQRTLNSIFKTYVDVIHFRKTDKKRDEANNPENTQEGQFAPFNEGDMVEEISPELEEELRKLGASPDIYEQLTKALAPSIWEMEDVKKGILCQMFGGTHKELPSAMGKYRGDINILMVGDPGTSKSQLLNYVHKIAPRGIYTSGKGSSAVGLTAYITKDPDTKDLVLESGALVLSDRGICCIDEFDKMSDSARSMLHEAMEQQTVSVAKAGIICTLNARTSVLAAANPVDSRYNPSLSVVENIQLPPTLLSRFDLIYLVLDKIDDQGDARLARHLVSLYYHTRDEVKRDMPMRTLTQYISYARNKIHPHISDGAADLLIRGYLEMRKFSDNRRTISATPRQLESVIRLAEAHARIRLSVEVEPLDVEEALRLMKVATQRAAVDPNTGLIDMDAITTGVSASARQRQKDLVKALREIMNEQSGPVNFLTLLDRLSDQSSVSIRQQDLDAALKRLADEGDVVISGSGSDTIVRRVS